MSVKPRRALVDDEILDLHGDMVDRRQYAAFRCNELLDNILHFNGEFVHLLLLASVWFGSIVLNR